MATQVRKVQGPPNGDDAFIRDYLLHTNALEDIRLSAGDRVHFDITCEGYAVEHSVLFPQTKDDPPQSSDENSDDDADGGDGGEGYGGKTKDLSEEERLTKEVKKRFKPAKWLNITLTPLPGTPRPTLSTVITVAGLESEICSPFLVTLSPDHALAKFIKHDEASGAITLRVACTEMHEGDETHDDWIYLCESYNPTGVSSPFLQDVWDKYQNAPVKEGVLYEDGSVPTDLSTLLNRQIDELAAKEPVDYHPGSNDCVRDLVHPSLYPFVRGGSAVTDEASPVLRAIADYNRTVKEKDDACDRWGRPFEASKYQWLPTVFEVDPKKRVSIDGYINNLDRDKYGGLYDSLARLFEIFLPRFQEVYGYAQQLKFLPKGDDYMDDMEAQNEYDADFAAKQLTDRPVRVITKIVDYELKGADDAINGVFHVEGMSSDHVIMTGVYVLRRDDDFSGGELSFKRQFLMFEGMTIYSGVTQCRHWKSERLVDDNMVPLGKLDTPEGRLIVFPNSHIHCLSKMVREVAEGMSARAEVSRRRVVVFWVVDPERDVMTTQLVPRQQGVMLDEKAKEHRLALMEERRVMKGKLNGERKVHLCEH